jgi:hypothetical protein
MLPMKDECECMSSYYVAFVDEVNYFAFQASFTIQHWQIRYLDSHIPNPRTLNQIVIPFNEHLWTQHLLKLDYNQQAFELLFLTHRLSKFRLL